MQDGIIKGTGNSRYLKSISNFLTQYPTYQDFVAALVAGTLPIDLNGINETGWDQLGTALNKANLLSDETAAALGLPNTAVPDDALMGLYNGKENKRLLNSWTYDGSPVVIKMSGFDPGFYHVYIGKPEAASGTPPNKASIAIHCQYGACGNYQAGTAEWTGSVNQASIVAFSPEGGSPVSISWSLFKIGSYYYVIGLSYYYHGTQYSAGLSVFSARHADPDNLYFSFGSLVNGMTVNLYRGE